MTSCIDTTSCPVEKQIHNVPCRFSSGLMLYVCNDITTCLNTSGRRDCCAYNVKDCFILESLLHVPTVQPTLFVRIDACSSQICPAKYNTNKCYWYESINSSLLCSENNNKYCCSQNRSDCCQNSKSATIIVFSVVACLAVLFIIYRHVTNYYSKIIPIKTDNSVESHGKYQITTSV